MIQYLANEKAGDDDRVFDLTPQEFDRIRTFRTAVSTKGKSDDTNSWTIRKQYLEFIDEVVFSTSFFNPVAPKDRYVPGASPFVLVDIIANYIHSNFYQGLYEVRTLQGETIPLYETNGPVEDLTKEILAKFKTKEKTESRRKKKRR